MSTRREMMLGSLSAVPILFLDSESKENNVKIVKIYKLKKYENILKRNEYIPINGEEIQGGDEIRMVSIEGKCISILDFVAGSKSGYLGEKDMILIESQEYDRLEIEI